MLKDIVFDSLEKAYNYMRGIKKMVKDRAKAEDFPVTTATPRERLKFLGYCIGMLNPADYPVEHREKIQMFKNLLKAEAQGYPIEMIAKMSGCSLETARKWRAEAMKYAQDAIHNRTKNALPLVGVN